MPTCYISSDPVFRPQRMFITAITKANPAVITTSIDHNYVTGLLVRLIVPNSAGMIQLNNKIFEITVTGDDTFSIPIDSTNFDTFVDAADPNQCAQVSPVGEINSILTAATKNVLTR